VHGEQAGRRDRRDQRENEEKFNQSVLALLSAG
jgi:hypothetical protein